MAANMDFHVFGEIHRNSASGQNCIEFSKLGQFVNDEIPKIMGHYPYVFIPSWVVMPDHVHIIIMIDVRGKTWNDGDGISNDGISNKCRCVSGHCRRVSRHAPTINDDNDHSMDNIPNEQSEYMASIAPKRGSLGLIIGRFKGAVTKYANDNHIPFQWQPRFYDCIIYDQDGFERVRRYINNNVAN